MGEAQELSQIGYSVASWCFNCSSLCPITHRQKIILFIMSQARHTTGLDEMLKKHILNLQRLLRLKKTTG
jgi:hypothetical protein